MWVCASGIYKVKNTDGTENLVNNMSDGFGGIMDFMNNMTGGFAGNVTYGGDGEDDIRRNDYHG